MTESVKVAIFMFHFIIKANMSTNKENIEKKIAVLNNREDIKVLREGFKTVPTINGIKLYINGKYINTYANTGQVLNILEVLEETLIDVNGNK